MNTAGPQARLVALIGLAALLFSPPLVLIFDRPPGTDPSWLPIYLFAAWLLVIGLAAWLMEHRQEES